MKKTISALSLVFVLASQTFAAEAGPVLIKSSDAGYTMPEHYFQKLCAIYLDKVVKTSKFGNDGILVQDERPITLDPNVRNLIDQAKEGPFAQEIGPTDIPSTGIYGFSLPGGAGADRVTLFQKGSGGSTSNENPATATLINIVNELCE